MQRFSVPFCVLSFVIAIAALSGPLSQGQTTAPPSAPTTEEKPRVFITDSQSWETRGAAGGTNGSWGAASAGGARPQTAEIIKTFGERCPQVMVNNREEIADYVVVLDHEGGKGYLTHRNKVAVFERVSGDAVISHSTLSLGGSVQDACEGITKHWAVHGAQLRSATVKQAATSAPVAVEQSQTGAVCWRCARFLEP